MTEGTPLARPASYDKKLVWSCKVAVRSAAIRPACTKRWRPRNIRRIGSLVFRSVRSMQRSSPAEADLQPRLLFEDGGLWETILKLKARIGSTDPGDRMYADALGGLLAHELLRLDGATARGRRTHRGGLAGWQQKRVIDF